MLADTLDFATEQLLLNDKSPKRKAGELDNRGSHYYLARYWAKALAEQDQENDLKARFTPVAEQLAIQETQILSELKGTPTAVDIGGYYAPDPNKVAQIMRPSATFNAIIEAL